MTPNYGKVRTFKKIDDKSELETIDSYQGGKRDWHKQIIHQTDRVYTYDDMVAPVLELLGKMKNESSPEISLEVRQTAQGFTLAASYLVTHEKYSKQ